LLHALFELALVRIGVATGAVETLPVVDRRFRLEFGGLFVAVGAGHGDVPAGQRELRLLVLGQGERRRLVSLEIVALIAGVEVGRRDKLPGVLILVARCALIKLDFEKRVLAFGDMALVAVHTGMPAFQRIRAGDVIFHSECRRLPALYSVAGEALASSVTLGKLAIVRIGLVAV